MFNLLPLEGRRERRSLFWHQLCAARVGRGDMRGKSNDLSLVSLRSEKPHAGEQKGVGSAGKLQRGNQRLRLTFSWWVLLWLVFQRLALRSLLLGIF
jgi:hypothetical protein